ncbi:glycoside hydrolase family 16 protein [Streptomyces cavernae]|uniref:glycoside hydrolase family 16 protein n=1 Tax=Streptomyces cavernae TaxID=2259034 RepID=UPI001391DF8D|nr:glycoside hydrolase family 16 protein [Streptomyces cavernae]
MAALALFTLLVVACGADGTAHIPVPPALASRPGNWRLVFHDEFSGSRLNRDDWTTCYDWNRGGCTNSSSNELEWYLPGQVSVEGGHLSLTAERRTTPGTDGQVHPWTSGMISTGRDHWYARPRRTFTYGYVEAAIRIPPQRGMAPQFWLMPASRYTPPELDIMESLTSTREVSMYVHWRNRQGEERQQKGSYTSSGFADRYHVFAVLWQADELIWYVDGIERFRVTDRERIPRVPMEILINLAVGIKQPPPSSVDTAQMRVDWVRVWQR